MQILLSNAILNTYFINHSRKEVGRKLRQVIKERGEKLLSAFEFLSKSEITPMELSRTGSFFQWHSTSLFPQVRRLLKSPIPLVISLESTLSSTISSSTTYPMLNSEIAWSSIS